ncbi:hypothetical protein ACDF64_07405 [Agromyces sp. MMS24-JH15]|uniref:hypothetical protein n=1 Tax=Agromyces sp. MMS24-JH15 TaxID=3243765 RepID=UPI003749C4DC
MSDTTGDAAATIDRRTLLKAGAWTAPVLVLATATPAAAASGTASGALTFTNLTYDWVSGDGGSFVGLRANTNVGFYTNPVGTVSAVVLVIEIENADGIFQVGGVPVLDPQSVPGWAATGGGVAIDVGGVPWIRYTFTWTGALTPFNATGLLLATVPLSSPQTPPVRAHAWTAVATAPNDPGVGPATGGGSGEIG